MLSEQFYFYNPVRLIPLTLCYFFQSLLVVYLTGDPELCQIELLNGKRLLIVIVTVTLFTLK